MRQKLALFALLCVSAAAGQTLNGGNVLTVVLKGQTPSGPVLEAIEREVNTAIEPSGVRLNWRPQGLAAGEVSGQVAIIQMRGQCTAAARVRADLPQAEPLGQTHVVNGQVLPFADLLCDAVHKLVDRDLRRVAPAEREELLGRALGRVLAHELYHILLRSTGHGSHGLSRSEQSSAELLAPENTFAASDERRMAESADSGGGGR